MKRDGAQRMEQLLSTLPDIRQDLIDLLRDDPVFSSMALDIDDPVQFTWTHFPGGFSGMVRIITGQQVSTKAAQSLWGKLTSQINPLTPSAVLAAGEEGLRPLGFSRQKCGYILSLAHAILNGTFDPQALEDMSDHDVRQAITALKGFGPWSANIYLLFCLVRRDVWPAGDLGIQMGVQRYQSLTERPSLAVTEQAGDLFRPRRSAASLLLWKLKSPS